MMTDKKIYKFISNLSKNVGDNDVNMSFKDCLNLCGINHIYSHYLFDIIGNLGGKMRADENNPSTISQNRRLEFENWIDVRDAITSLDRNGEVYANIRRSLQSIKSLRIRRNFRIIRSNIYIPWKIKTFLSVILMFIILIFIDIFLIHKHKDEKTLIITISAMIAIGFMSFIYNMFKPN